MIIKLSIKDRLTIGTLFPSKSDLRDMLMCERVRELIQLSKTEIIKVGYESDSEGRTSWNPNIPMPELDVDFERAEIELFKSRVDSMNKEKSIPLIAVGICKKFRDYQYPEKPKKSSKKK